MTGEHTASDTGPVVGLSVWATAQAPGPVQRRGRYLPASTAHPARMLPAIAAHAIRAYTVAGDLVGDPMAGVGTTLVEAMHLGRDAVGVECESRWSDIADANITHARTQGAPGRAAIVRGDATHLTGVLPAVLHGRFALIVTSPPYGPTVHGQVRPTREVGVVKSDNTYGQDPTNLAHRNPTGLVDGFTRILAGCHTLLRPGGILVVTARPFRSDGELVDLPSAVISAGTGVGLVLWERCVALLAAVRDNRLLARPSFFQLQQVRLARARGIRMHLITHEDVLVLRKPINSRSSEKLKDDHDELKGGSTSVCGGDAAETR